MKNHKHTTKIIRACGCNKCDNYVSGPKGIGALNLLRCEHCKEKHSVSSNYITIELLNSMYCRDGEKVSIKINGKLTTRRVYYKGWFGYYIMVNGFMFSEHQLPVAIPVTFDDDGNAI